MKNVGCIFAFRCADQIGRTIARVDALPFLDQFDHFLIIDNNSPDETVKRAEQAIRMARNPSRFKIRKNPENVGLGGSHKIAISYAREINADWLFLLHGDDQGNPKDFVKALDLIRQDPQADAYLGSRFMRGSQLKGYSRKREWANRGLNILYSLILRKRVYELGAGLSAHRVSFFENERYLTFTNDFHFYSYMLIDYIRSKAKIQFFPISWFETDQQSNVRNLYIGWITLKAVFQRGLLGRS